MNLSDRFLTCLKGFLEARISSEDLPEVRLGDSGEEFPEMCVILDVEDEPVEDEEVRGQYEVQSSVSLRCRAGSDDEVRRSALESFWEVLEAPADGDEDEYDFVRWMRTETDRGIEPEELGVFDMLMGGGVWEVTDEEVTGVIEVTALVMPVDLREENFTG